jgi:hypothetical protein
MKEIFAGLTGLAVMMGLGFVLIGDYIKPGVTYKKRRQLARARAAKKRKRRKR